MKLLDWVVLGSLCLFAGLSFVAHIDASIERHNAVVARQDSILAYLERTMPRIDTLENQMGYATGRW